MTSKYVSGFSPPHYRTIIIIITIDSIKSHRLLESIGRSAAVILRALLGLRISDYIMRRIFDCARFFEVLNGEFGLFVTQIAKSLLQQKLPSHFRVSTRVCLVIYSLKFCRVIFYRFPFALNAFPELNTFWFICFY